MQPTDSQPPGGPPDSAGQPADAPARRKSKGGGCMVVLLIFVGLGILAIGGLGVMCYSIYQDPAVKEVVGAVGSMFKAPGRRELIAAGCDGAMVFDMRAFAEIAKKDPDADPEEIERLQDAVFVNCVFNGDEPRLTCAQVARAYRDAVPDGPSRVSVYIQTAGNREPACSGMYDATGVYLGDAEALPEGPMQQTPWQTPTVAPTREPEPPDLADDTADE